MDRKFDNANDFRKSLEMRLKNYARASNIDLIRVQRAVAFERLLARLFALDDPMFLLKGGYAMELRVVQPRATRDVDLTCLARARSTGEYLTQTILSELRRLADLPMDDHFVFRIGEAKHDLENAPYGGARYPVTAMLAGRPFIQFQLDVGADSVVATPERLPGKGWLGF